jgi:hypothetical protein
VSIGVLVRVHDLYGEELGIAHLPPPVEIGDLIAFEHSEHRVCDVVVSPAGSLVAAEDSSYEGVREQLAELAPD